MVRWLSHGHDATARQESTPQAKKTYHDDAAVVVLDLAPPKSGNIREAMDRLVQQARTALSRGQAVAFINWEPELQMKWGWNERDLAEIIGGIATDGSPSLEKEVQWQCKNFIHLKFEKSRLILLHSYIAANPGEEDAAKNRRGTRGSRGT